MPTNQFILACLLFTSLLFSALVPEEVDSAYAQGNLAIIFTPQSGRTSDQHPQMANLSSLWCQATSNNENRLPIKSARFVHTVPLPVRTHEAEVTTDRAHLKFGTVTSSAIGKYKCEITTQDDEFVTGNLFVYMRPILLTNDSTKIEQTDEERPFEFTGASLKAVRGETARLVCPAIGYPLPEINWLKDLKPINLSDQGRYVLTGNQLLIREASDEDEGTYRCVASNHFSTDVDGPQHFFAVTLDMSLRITSSLSWLVPLIVIIVTLVLLFLTIYLCAAWKRYKYAAQYNVAEKERNLHRSEEQKLRDDEDDE